MEKRKKKCFEKCLTCTTNNNDKDDDDDDNIFYCIITYNGEEFYCIFKLVLQNPAVTKNKSSTTGRNKEVKYAGR